MWLIEYDVFIPSTAAFVDVDFAHPSADLLIRSYSSQAEHPEWPNWHLAREMDTPMKYHGLVCAIRVSRELLDRVVAIGPRVKRLPYVESLYITLAMAPPALEVQKVETWSFAFNNRRPELEPIRGMRHYTADPSMWWHPVKNPGKQAQWHREIRESHSAGR